MGKWLPKFVVCLKSYTPRLFVSDLLAGSTVGLVALPLGDGLRDRVRCFTASGPVLRYRRWFLAISAFGGSSTQIGGPTGAFVVVVFGIVSRYGIDGLFVCTLMAGVLLLILGATGLGTAVKFIPCPVVVA